MISRKPALVISFDEYKDRRSRTERQDRISSLGSSVKITVVSEFTSEMRSGFFESVCLCVMEMRAVVLRVVEANE